MTGITLPYYVPSHELPQPLPTIQEIHSAKEVLKTTIRSKVVRIGPYVIKYGPVVNPIEAENMLFVKRETTVPVPLVYAIYQLPKHTDSDHTYIVMEYVQAKSLLDIWSSLDLQRKESICLQLWTYVDQLRMLPSPGYYGSIGRRGLLNNLFWTDDDKPLPLNGDGPFYTEHELNRAICMKFRESGESSERFAIKADFYEQIVFPALLKGHAPVFTHSDFQRKNIMIRIKPSTEVQDWKLEDDNFDVVIIDWGSMLVGIRRTGNLSQLHRQEKLGLVIGFNGFISA